jgi:peptidoglycan/LPS O-acetylase OafA/YrhL
MIKINNFDFLRLLFAIFVIITHSYPLSGSVNCDWLCSFTETKLQFSTIGVKGFFIISGYLIYQSLLRSKSWVDYFWKRILRLFPGLFMVLLLTVLLLPFVYEGDVGFFDNKKVYSYVFRNLSLIKLQYSIPGVFEKNVYGMAINGSLWTICYEFTMYVLLSVFIFFKSKRTVVGVLLCLWYVAFFVFYFLFSSWFSFYFYDLNSTYLSELGLFFLGGSLLGFFNFRDFKFINTTLVLFGILIFVSEMFFQDSVVFRVLLWPVFIIGIGEKATPLISQVGTRIGDLSYVIYIYGFPIQQTLMYFFDFSALELMLLSIPISMVLGYFSWHSIEKRMLSYKNVDPLSGVRILVGKMFNYKRNLL